MNSPRASSSSFLIGFSWPIMNDAVGLFVAAAALAVELVNKASSERPSSVDPLLFTMSIFSMYEEELTGRIAK